MTRTNVAPTAAAVAESLLAHHFRFVDEYELQAGVRQVLELRWPQTRVEPRLGAASRLDFRVDNVAVEIKVASGTAAVLRQLRRYAEHPDVRELVLVTSRSNHTHLTARDVGCPLQVVLLPGVA